MKERLLSLVGFSMQRDSLKTEIESGFTTFLTMVYILALMPVMFEPLREQGFPVDSIFTATALAAAVGTLLMAFIAKKPFGLAPGLTLNAFFVETVCVSLGYPWQFALTAVLVEGLLFVFLCVTNIRQMIFEMVPTSLKYAFAAGIGFFIAMIGFKNNGLLAEGTVFNHMETLVTPNSLLFILGMVLTTVFTIMRLKGGLLLGILIVTVVGVPLGVTVMPDDFIKMPSSAAPLFCRFSFDYLLLPDFWVCVVTMLFFDVLDSLGTVVGVMACSGIIRKDGRIPHMRRIMLSDALATVTGACLGCSTVTTYVESATGFAEGGRTGLSSFVVSLCFMASLFLAPVFLAIPAAATAPVMVMAGFYLLGVVRHINLSDPTEAMPAFLTILLMPVTGSITDGILAGLFSYIVLSLLKGRITAKTNVSNK
ncbi:NCS2 family permease [Prevotella sp. E15-22]|uniref:NCS2 family permease n=1 Tax=Prevotella sp. E15-22 TaxID=2937774 RepID=UPI0020468AFC|nr:NCS2 family permease [Prevotella sp. E15-22]UPS43882.1 NCS2 family permease [Prevotella sp. E15-22]